MCRRGIELPWAKLNDEIVRRIRTEHQAKEKAKRELDAKHGADALAKKYGVSKSNIEKVLTYATWRHVRDA